MPAVLDVRRRCNHVCHSFCGDLDGDFPRRYGDRSGVLLVMTPERLAEIEQSWEAKNLPMVKELLTALREAQAEPPPDLVDRWMKNELADYAMVIRHCAAIYFSELAAERDALQRRVEGLEKVLYPFAFPTEADGTFIVLGKDVNLARAALRGGRNESDSGRV